MATRYPPGSQFLPTELGLVKLHLKDKVEKNIDGFIKTLNVYGDAPWLLHHDTNPLYPRNEWYYFVPRRIRGVKTVSRMVPRNGESFLGGTWKSIGKRKDIKKKAKELMGYKRELVFNMNVVGDQSEKQKKTDWHMNEYSLHRNGDEFHDLVLCHVRLLNSAQIFRPPVVPAAHDHVDDNNNDVVLPNQEQEEEAGFAMLEYEGGDVNQHEQQQEEQEDSLIPLPCPFQSNYNQGQYLLEAIAYQNDMMILKNDRNQQQHEQQEHSPTLLLPPLQQSNDNLEHYQLEDYAYDGADDDDLTFDPDELLNSLNKWKEQEDSPTDYLLPPLESNVNQEHCLSRDTLFVPSQLENNDNSVLPKQEQQEAGFANHNDMTMMVEKEHGDVKQHQQQQDQEQQHKDLLSLLLDPAWDDLCFDGPEDDFSMQNMDVSLTQQELREVEEEISKLLQPVPQAQDSEVHVDQVMPKD
ncbi:hypothetical protein Bca52824_006925 [Brassica carinata]|uniref:NAC domain-containing protein n=1 Tax=Brassica carinata TaxID=52824 RepID=A0A8X7W5C8_BRACI|nr:hypothetical protein Bca52824_006922 [Brassica carinata]KAG2324197.1 hypothetical protein Bca52824_006925 [Brassica carinata]